MIKKIASLLLFLILSCVVFSQEKQLEYSAEILVANTSADELHARCMDWFSKSFNLPNKVHIESTEDKIIALPELIYYPNFIWGSGVVMGTITYTLEVDVSDGKFTYILNNFVHHGDPLAWNRSLNFGLITNASKSPLKISNQVLSQMAWNDIKCQIRDQMTPLIENLKEEMTKAPEKKGMDGRQ